MGPLRVALALDDSLDRPDGVQQHVLTLGRWLSEQGHDVHYLAPSTTRTDLPGLHQIGSSLSVRANGNVLRTPTMTSVRVLRTLLHDVRPDVLHVALPCSPLLGGRLAANAPKGTAAVGTFHILPATRAIEWGAFALGKLQRRQMRHLDRVTAVSAPAREFARRTFGLSSRVVANPVAVEEFARAGDGRRTTEPVEVLFLGRLVERKGPDLLLRAVARMHRAGLAHVPYRVTIAGDGPLRESLEARIREAGLDSLVRFTGFVDESAKPDLLASVDVVVLPSIGGESFGISVVEALAATHGVVLAGDNPGYRSVMGPLVDQVVPVHCDTQLAAALAAAINSCRQGSARERQLSRAREFDVERVGGQVVEVYREAIRARRGDGARSGVGIGTGTGRAVATARRPRSHP